MATAVSDKQSRLTANDLPLVFDGHNDVLTQLMRNGGVGACSLFSAGSAFHVDLPKAKAGGFAGGFFAIWVPSPDTGVPYQELMSQASYDVPLPEPLIPVTTTSSWRLTPVYSLFRSCQESSPS